MVRKKSFGSVAFDVSIVAICALLGFITLYPMWYVICCSISDPYAVLRNDVVIWPVGFSLESFKTVFSDANLLGATKMSVFYTLTALVGMMATCTLMAFPLTRPNLKFRKLVVIFLVIPMYFTAGMVPRFIMFTKVINLYNTVWAVVLPSFVSIFNIILCRTYMASLPNDMCEAAYIDGAGNWQVFTRIVLPLCKPVLAVIAIYTIVGNWNAWWNSMIYQTKTDLHPLQMYLRRLIIQQSVNLTDLASSGADADEIAQAAQKAMAARQLKYSFIVVTTVPILMVYPMFQKHFVKGVMLGSLKG